VKNDYEFYEKHIRRFNKDLFRFGDLEDRKSAYVGLAETQRQRAQIQLRKSLLRSTHRLVWIGHLVWVRIFVRTTAVACVGGLWCSACNPFS